MLTQGGTVVTLENRSFDAAAHPRRHRARGCGIGGDGRRRLRPADARGARRIARPLGPVSLTMLVSAGVMWSAETKAALAQHLPPTLLVDLLGSTEAHGLGSAVATPGRGADDSRVQARAPRHGHRRRRPRPRPGRHGHARRRRAVPGRLPQGPRKDRPHVPRRRRPAGLGSRRLGPAGGTTARSTLLGRGSLCINTGGEKVFPEEVEEALETHPAVRD